MKGDGRACLSRWRLQAAKTQSCRRAAIRHTSRPVKLCPTCASHMIASLNLLNHYPTPWAPPPVRSRVKTGFAEVLTDVCEPAKRSKTTAASEEEPLVLTNKAHLCPLAAVGNAEAYRIPSTTTINPRRSPNLRPSNEIPSLLHVSDHTIQRRTSLHMFEDVFKRNVLVARAKRAHDRQLSSLPHVANHRRIFGPLADAILTTEMRRPGTSPQP